MNSSALYLPKLLPIEFCHFFTHVLLRQADQEQQHGDSQVPNAKAILHHEIMFETVQERLWPVIEQFTQKQLLPTYAYARLYSNGDRLENHTDRPACEFSATIQLGRSHHYSWPIYMGGKRYDMAEGDAVIYMGCDIEHWRNECDGPEGYYSGQLFVHYVDADGVHANQAGDKDSRDERVSFIKNRTILMENK